MKLPAAWLAWLIATFALATGSPGFAQPSNKPNIVVMLMDNLGYGELGVYGGGILRGTPTPTIDKLASEGMRLLNFNVEAQCTPSRSAFMTGRFSIRSGTYQVPAGGVPDGLVQWEITLPQLLSQQGYSTGMWGKWHLGSADARLPTNRGFDEWFGIPRTSMRRNGHRRARQTACGPRSARYRAGTERSRRKSRFTTRARERSHG